MNLSILQRKLAGVGALVAALICSVGLVSSVVGALPANTPPAGPVSLAPASGDSGTTFALAFSAAQFCPGDATAGFLWGTFLTSATNDPATLTFSASGNPIAPAGFSTTLRDPTGTPVRNQNPGLTDGIINPPGFLSFSGASFASVPPGDYWIGIACTRIDASFVIQNVKYWSSAVSITASTGAGPNNFTFGPATVQTTTTTTTTAATTTTTTAATTTTTTVARPTTTTTVAGGTTTTTTVAGSPTATVTPAAPSAGGSYSVSFSNCQVGETITFAQPQSTPASVPSTCRAAASLGGDGPIGLRAPAQLTTGTATASFTAPIAPGSYTVTMTGTVSAQRTATFVIAGTATPPVGGSNTGGASTGGSPTFGSTGTIPATGSSTTAVIVWGVLLLVFGRMAILLGRKPKVRPAGS